MEKDAGPRELLFQGGHASIEAKGGREVLDQSGGEEGVCKGVDLLLDVVHDGLQLEGLEKVVLDEEAVVEELVELW